MCNSFILTVLANAVSVITNKTHDRLQEGLPPPRLAGRIMGEADANIQDTPYQVSLQHDGTHQCAGSIISKSWIVTAAHCVNKVKKKSITIRSGTSYANSGGTVRQAVKIFQHARFDPLTFDYDIAIVKVSPPFTIGAMNEKVIRLPKSENYRPRKGVMALISSWGITYPSKSSVSDHLQSVRQPIISRKKCQQAYLFLYVSDRMICVGNWKGRQRPCQGDSGSPLVTNGRLVGIVSKAFGCGTPGYLGVYANIAHFLPWIKTRINV